MAEARKPKVVEKVATPAPQDNLGVFESNVAEVVGDDYEPVIQDEMRNYRKYTEGITPEMRTTREERLRAYVARYQAWLQEGGK